jgi:histidinol-phosphatase
MTANAAELEPLAELRSFAHSVADAAGAIALHHFRAPLDVQIKADLSPVTVADRAIEEMARKAIRQRFPDHGLYGEEYGASDLGRAYVWVIDPIDGTKSFISGFPLFGTLIGLLHHGRPMLGLVDMPFMRERWCGAEGETRDAAERLCLTRGQKSLAGAILYTTSPDSFTPAGKEAFGALSAAVGLTRFGGDCYAYALLAAGHVDAVVEEGLRPYDYLPLVTVIEGAGGVVSDWQGQPLHLASDGRVVAAATPELHAALLEELARCP